VTRYFKIAAISVQHPLFFEFHSIGEVDGSGLDRACGNREQGLLRRRTRYPAGGASIMGQFQTSTARPVIPKFKTLL
jgi:hypothetical protein